jgi:hypothetical protein
MIREVTTSYAEFSIMKKWLPRDSFLSRPQKKS